MLISVQRKSVWYTHYNQTIWANSNINTTLAREGIKPKPGSKLTVRPRVAVKLAYNSESGHNLLDSAIKVDALELLIDKIIAATWWWLWWCLPTHLARYSFAILCMIYHKPLVTFCITILFTSPSINIHAIDGFWYDDIRIKTRARTGRI
jgi:hypothetical protein